MEFIWRWSVFTCLFILLLPLSQTTQHVTVQPSRTVAEGESFQLCSDSNNSSLTYSISPSSGIMPAAGMIPTNSCSPAINVANNCAPGDSRTLNITIMDGSNITMLTVMITDNDIAVNVTLNPTEFSLIEGEVVTVCAVIPSPPCEDILFQLKFRGTGSSPAAADDYTITPASSMSTIVMGATPAQACITVSTVFDSMMEPEETFAISWEPTLSYVNFVTSNETTFTIRDRPSVNFQMSSYSFNEGSGSQTLQISLSESLQGAGTATVGVMVSSGADARFSLSTTSVSFTGTNTTKSVTVNIMDDEEVQNNATVTLMISVVGGLIQLGNTSTTIITIVDNDTAVITVPTMRSVSESSGTLSLCLSSFHKIIGGTEVNYTISSSSDSVGETFIGPTSSSVRILSNSTGINCADIALIGNSVIERTRVFTVTWSLVDDFNGRVTLSRANTSISVTDDDSGAIDVPDSVRFSKSPSGREVCVMVPALGRKANGASYLLNYSISGSQNDFTVMPVVLEISSRMQSNHCITINITDDSLVEGNETFTLTWLLDPTAPTGLTLSRTTTVITILDNDVAIIGFDPVSYTVMEGESVSVMVRVFSGQLQTQVSANINTPTPVTGLSPFSRVITFSSMVMDNATSISTTDDNMFTGNRSFTVVLTSNDPLVRLMNDHNMATVLIVEDDMRPIPTPSPSPSSSPSSFPSSSPPTTPTTPADLPLAALIGIIVGGVVLAIIVLLVVIFCVCIARLRVNRQGFYFTNEDKSEAPQMLRYSASLRSLSSQTVMPIDGRDKENEYMV